MSAQLTYLGQFGYIAYGSKRLLTKSTVKRHQVSHCEDASWTCDPVYLTDICERFSAVNSKLRREFQRVSELQ
jgi:hypothetical protein